MPPSFRSENPAEGGGGSALFACAKAGAQRREDERHRTEKGIRKITFREVPGRSFRGKAGAVKPLPGGFFDAHVEKIRKNPLSKPKITVKMHNQTFIK